eukprot:COSAG04_NODE_2192_length_4564_cov_4.871669_4_plen_161_part_00
MPTSERLTALVAGVAVGAASAALCSGRAAATPSTPKKDPESSPEGVERLRARYKSQGFVKLSGLLSADEVETWRAALAKAMADQLARSGGRYHNQNAEIDVASGDYGNQGEDAGHYRTVFVQCVNMWKKSESIRALLFEELAPRLRGLVCGIVGCESFRL